MSTDINYEVMSQRYKNSNSVITEMVNLQAILNLPKGTEHYLSDIHGEYDAFYHIIQNASGAIRMYIEDVFGFSISKADKKNLALLIYYPEERLRISEGLIAEEERFDFYKITLFRLMKILKRCTIKYTRSKVRKALPKEHAYILEELIHEDINDANKQLYYTKIISSIVELGTEKEVIVAICSAIHKLVVDRLHVIGDIYDRGLYPDKVMDFLSEHHSFDIQWGNHDVSWIGANMGNEALICTVIRICARYNNLELLENAYSINLKKLREYAETVFAGDNCEVFSPKDVSAFEDQEKVLLCAKIHKAITLLQFKVEAEIIARCPEYKMEDRNLLHRIDYEKGVLTLDGVEYELLDKKYQSIDKDKPYHITEVEREILQGLKDSFINSERLTNHIKILIEKGAVYSKFNGNLLVHGCIPMTKNGEFTVSTFLGEKLSGKALMDRIDSIVKAGYVNRDEKSVDLMWYLWCGEHSPLFGKDKMACFERYLTSDKKIQKERKDPYFNFRDDEAVVVKILEDFGLDKDYSKIINGHVPVEVKKGESPIKANGKLIAIDGGLTKAYQKLTGIAGYTLISNSVGMYLAEHEPFTSLDDIIKNGNEVISKNETIEIYQRRMFVNDTENGKKILGRIEDLKKLKMIYDDMGI